MKKIKSLLFLPYLAPYRIDALNEIGKYYDLTVVFLIENPTIYKYNRKDLEKQLEVDYVYLNSGFRFRTRTVRFGIFKLIKQYNPKVIFSNEFGLTSILIALFLTLRLLRFTHISTTSDNIDMATYTHAVRRIARNFVLRSCSGLIVYNTEVEKWYQKKFKKLKVRTCPNIQNPISILKGRKEVRRLAQNYIEKYKLDNKVVYLYVGRFHAMKGLDKLIAVFNKVKKKEEVLVLVGGGSEKEKLFNLIEKLNLKSQVIMPGGYYGQELFGWYELANLFILPSIHEPFGAVVNESLIFGTPVLCSSFAGATYYIDEENNGLVFNPLNREDFIFKFKKARSIFKDFNKEGESLMTVDFRSSLKIYNNMYK